MDRPSSNMPRAIVLGGTFPHTRLLENLRKRGFHTVLVDYYENPPAKVAADEHIRESTLDQEAVLEIARQRQAKLVISTCIDQANVTACYVAEKLCLPAPYSYETALTVTNKGLMKKMMVDHGIPTSRHLFVHEFADIDGADLDFPLIVKPADANSSKGVRKTSTRAELDEYLPDALRISRTGGAIVEEYKEGREIGADCFIRDGEATIVLTRERRKVVPVAGATQQIQGSYWPADLSEQNQAELKRIIEQIGRVFGLDNTPLMIQTIFNGDDIHVIEFAPRIGGGENYRIIEKHTGFDLIDAAIDSFLGGRVELDVGAPDGYYGDIYVYVRPCRFGKFCGNEALVRDGVVEYVNVYKSPGVEIRAEMSSNNRVGAFLVKGADKQELHRKISIAIKAIDVCDMAGRSVMRKDIYTSSDT